MSQNSTIGPIVLASPYSFLNDYAAKILGSKQNIAQVNRISIASQLCSQLLLYILQLQLQLQLVDSFYQLCSYDIVHSIFQVSIKPVFDTENSFYLYGIGPTEVMLNLVRYKLIMKHGWEHIGILSSVGIHSKVTAIQGMQIAK